MKRVVILQHRLLHYRVSLFEMLRESLYKDGVELILVYGNPSPQEAFKQDTGSLPWALKVDNFYIRIFGRDLLWQKLPNSILDASLIIAMQENKIISNYWLQLFWRGNGRLFAFWGHGKNLQSRAPSGLLERWKRLFVNKVDWWFAYTSSTVDFLRSGGYPVKRATCLNNSIDVGAFSSAVQGVSSESVLSARLQYGISHDSPVGLYCGSLYQEKRLDLLVELARKVRSQRANFVLVVVGDGPLMAEMQKLAAGYDWIKVLGAKKGQEKAILHRMAALLLCPGALGLQVLDSLAAQLPVVTIAESLHGPEFAYLVDGQNSIISAKADLDDLAERVISVLSDADELDKLRRGCLQSAESYSIENMVAAFHRGILDCLRRD